MQDFIAHYDLAKLSPKELKRKLAFRAWHRGTREMDFVVGSFADRYLDDFDDHALQAFARILELPDQDIMALCINFQQDPAQPLPDGVDHGLLLQLLAFAQEASAFKDR